ncbi:MAG: coat protein [Archaeoglobales archaeon]|nr:MAG: coat protein [Archaeoglobales archaeon]
MPLYKTGLDMWKKYQAKFNPTVIGTRFTDVQSIAVDRAQEGLNMVATARDLVRPILDEYGITGGMRATYLAFGLALLRHIVRQKGDAGKKISSGLKSYYVNAYGLDPSVCDEIIQVIAGWVMPY